MNTTTIKRQSMLTVLANIWAHGSFGRDGAGSFDRAKHKFDNYQGLKAHVPIANNTWIHKDAEGNHHIRLHQTDIMSFAPNGDTTINCDGWASSPTTSSRIDSMLPAGAQIRSDYRRRTRANPVGPRRWLHLPDGSQHEYHDGISFNQHTGEILPDDHVRPVGNPVMPPRARGQGNTRTPRPRGQGDFRGTPTYRPPSAEGEDIQYDRNAPRRGQETCQHCSRPIERDNRLDWVHPGLGGSPDCSDDDGYDRLAQPRERGGSGFGGGGYVVEHQEAPERHRPGANYSRENDRAEIRELERQRPGSDSYDSSSSWTAPKSDYGDDMPREGEDFPTWLGRTETPPPTECRTCRGKGYVRTGREMNKSDCEKCEGTGERTPPHTSALQQNDLEELSMTYLFGLRTLAFGETVAPVDVDTLRDEECPVCGESSSSFDGKTCQVCGFDAPPVMFRDPDLEKARSLDLRKDVIDDGSQLPGQDGLTQGQQDANGGMPGEVPGNGVPGSDQIPMDPSMLGPDGQSLPGAEGEVPAVDPAQIVQEQMEQLQSGQPLTPDMLGPDGSVGQGGDPMGETMDQNGDPIDPGALDANGAPMDPAAMSPGLPPSVDPNLLQELGPDGNPLNPTQGPGEFQQGPNGPEGPGGPEETVDPGALDANGAPVAPDGQQYTGDPAAGDPGTPEDGTADLICPACGYSTDAQRPTSTDMDTQAVSPAGSGDGTMAGDVCPNCGAATMESSGQMEQMAQQMEQPVNQPPAVNSNTMTAPV